MKFARQHRTINKKQAILGAALILTVAGAMYFGGRTPCPKPFLAVVADGGWWGRYYGAHSLVQDRSGNIIVGGAPWSIRKYDRNLNLLARATDPSAARRDGTIESVAVDDAGNVVVAGSVRISKSIWNWRIVKYDSTLKTIMGATEYTCPVTGDGQAEAVGVDVAGHIFVVGSEGRDPGGDFYGEERWRVLKYDEHLTTVLATTRYEGPASRTDTPSALALDAAGNVVVAGNSTAPVYTSGGVQESDGWESWVIRKYDPTLTVLLGTTVFDGPGHATDIVRDIVVAPSDRIVVAGSSQDESGREYWTIRSYDATLTQLLGEVWSRGPGRNKVGDSWAQAVAVDAAGQIVVGGGHWLGNRKGAWRLDLYDPELKRALATARGEKIGLSNMDIRAVAAGSSGEILLAGSYYPGGMRTRWLVAKLAVPAAR